MAYTKPADWFKRATEISQAELQNYWRWGFRIVKAEYDIDHDDDKEIYFAFSGTRARCGKRAWCELLARLTRGTYLRGSVSGYFSAPTTEVGWGPLINCPIPNVLRFIIRDEAAGIDYEVGSMGKGGFRSFGFPFDWVLDPTHEYSMRFEVWNYIRYIRFKVYQRWHEVLAEAELWVEDITVDTDAVLTGIPLPVVPRVWPWILGPILAGGLKVLASR